MNRMRLSALLLFLCATATQLYSQSFRAGLKAGISASQVSGDALGGFNKAGLIGGAFIERQLTDKLSYQFEMLYVEKGSRKATRPDKGDFTYFLLILDYVEVPILVKYKKDKFIYEAGLGFGRLLNWSVQNESGYYPKLHPESRPFFKEEFSFNLGISYPLYKRVFMNWRFSNSILPVRNHQGNAVYRFNRGQYNAVLEFTLNYKFEPSAGSEKTDGKP